jgi:hypothetical protein
MRKLLLTLAMGSTLALLLLTLSAYLEIRYTPWGQLSRQLASEGSKTGVSEGGDPSELLARGVFVQAWVIAPIVAVLVGGVAGVIYRRPSGQSVLSLWPIFLLVVIPMGFSATAVLAIAVYVGIAWFASWVTGRLFCPRSAPCTRGAIDSQ